MFSTPRLTLKRQARKSWKSVNGLARNPKVSPFTDFNVILQQWILNPLRRA